MRGVPFHSLNSATLAPPWRDQYTPAEEDQHDAEQAATEHDWLDELEPDTDPFDEKTPAALERPGVTTNSH